jgi:hypothetical protein
MKNEQEYINLLNTLINIGEANRGLDSGDGRNIDAEGLLTKFFFMLPPFSSFPKAQLLKIF